MDSLISFRKFHLDDARKIFKLTKQVWPEEVPSESQWIKGWRWLHLANPSGKSKIELAEMDEVLLGQYALILQTLKVDSDIITASQIVDTMTHPKYRKLGIASKLGETVLRGLQAQGVYLAIGFPNQQAYPFHMKRGWIDIGPFNVMLKPVSNSKIVRKYNLKGLILIIFAMFSLICNKPQNYVGKSHKHITIKKIHKFDSRIEKFWNSISNQYKIALVRDDKYLNWRYVDHPNIEYIIYIAEESNEIRGYIVLGDKYIDNLHYGIIYDIIGPINRTDIIYSLIMKAIEFFDHCKVDIIYCKMISDKVYINSFLKNGFIPTFNAKSRFIVFNPGHQFENDFISDPRNWFIQEGDLPGVY